MSSIDLIWFRRDLRLRDLPSLLSAADSAASAVAVFVLDDALLRPGPRRTFLFGCLRRLDEDLGGRLLVTHGDPVRVIGSLARELDVGAVHISADFTPYGIRRDHAVAVALGDVPLVPTGSPYAVAPGRVRKADGKPYKVFTPFRRAWLEHNWRPPALTSSETVNWVDPTGLDCAVPIPVGDDGGVDLPPAGEGAALSRWDAFSDDGLARYHVDRDRPDLDATTRLSPYLKFGCIHPRTLLADLDNHRGDGATALRSELGWREFYADVLYHRPDTLRANHNPRFDAIRYNTGATADAAFAAWTQGRTGFPIVDAGMRQLLAQGWVHNRVRMIVASFLTKDLHLPWWWGARHFMAHLVDGDLAANQHGWQWTAGSGTDAAPYFRVFNPTRQGEKFDPDGDYVRRWVPELRAVAGMQVHQLPGVRPPGYPDPIVDHAVERKEALARYREV
ncbi:cryptochrome/photolyase family protein [Gordonia defluvii]|uniref:cryptochrome/photolyase family protein n=1 Tax=Gordonia defluvii TaxID=283718 RepID=UPI0031E0F070